MFSNSDLKELGARLVKLREARGLSAAYVAHEVLGYAIGSHVAITRLERAILAEPRRDHLEKLAAYFEVDPSHLMVGKTAEAPSASAHVKATETKKPAVKAEVKKVTVPAVKSRAVKERMPTTFAGRVRYVRETAELDERTFAQELSKLGALITSTNVMAWESGEREANPIQLRALARLAKRTEDWFLTGSDAKSSDEDVPLTGAWLGWATSPAAARA